MTAKEAYEKAKENLPKKLAEDAKEQDAVITEIYRIIDVAAGKGLMMFLSEPIKKKHEEALFKKLTEDGFKCEIAEEIKAYEKIKVKISWENGNT